MGNNNAVENAAEAVLEIDGDVYFKRYFMQAI